MQQETLASNMSWGSSESLCKKDRIYQIDIWAGILNLFLCEEKVKCYFENPMKTPDSSFRMAETPIHFLCGEIYQVCYTFFFFSCYYKHATVFRICFLTIICKGFSWSITSNVSFWVLDYKIFSWIKYNTTLLIFTLM